MVFALAQLMVAIAASLAIVLAVVVLFPPARILGRPSKPDAVDAESGAPTAERVQQAADVDDEITVVGLPPITLDETRQADQADSEVNRAEDLGTTRPIVHDPGAADEEPSAVHALILVSAVGQTHRGRRRKNNQDAFAVLSDHHTFVVADGMGGYAGGEVASKIAVDSITEAFEKNTFKGHSQGDLPRAGAQLATAIQMGNRAIWDEAQAKPELEGMGTTLVAARFSPRRERVYIGHVGDSRCYRLREGEMRALTEDHNLGNMGVTGRNAHMLTRALGIGPAVEVDLIMAEPRVGDHYLMCSDGLNKMLRDHQIADVVRIASTPEVAVETLIGRANDAGGKDNITVILIRVDPPHPINSAESLG